MAGFKTHITTSTIVGMGYGAGALVLYDVPLPTCVLAAGLCSVSGMLPDVDSDSGVPLRESLAFAAAVVPMLMLERFRELGMSHESIVIAGALVYLLIRFGVGGFLKRYTVHRGMFHSLPAAAICAQLSFLICSCEDEVLRYYKAGAVLLGYLTHLLLDELYSLHWHRGRLRFKKSFGTALKLWSDSLWANVSTYGKLGLLTYVLMHEHGWMQHFRLQSNHVHHVVEKDLDSSRR